VDLQGRKIMQKNCGYVLKWRENWWKIGIEIDG